MRRLDAERVHQPDGVLRHVAQLVGGCDRNFQKSQLEKLGKGNAASAGKMARLADVAIVEADDAKAAARELPAEIVLPMDHLGAQPHDQQHRLRTGIAEDIVAEVDAVGADDLRRLMGSGVHLGNPSSGFLVRNSMTRFFALQKAPRGGNRRPPC